MCAQKFGFLFGFALFIRSTGFSEPTRIQKLSLSLDLVNFFLFFFISIWVEQKVATNLNPVTPLIHIRTNAQDIGFYDNSNKMIDYVSRKTTKWWASLVCVVSLYEFSTGTKKNIV